MLEPQAEESASRKYASIAGTHQCVSSLGEPPRYLLHGTSVSNALDILCAGMFPQPEGECVYGLKLDDIQNMMRVFPSLRDDWVTAKNCGAVFVLQPTGILVSSKSTGKMMKGKVLHIPPGVTAPVNKWDEYGTHYRSFYIDDVIFRRDAFMAEIQKELCGNGYTPRIHSVLIEVQSYLKDPKGFNAERDEGVWQASRAETKVAPVTNRVVTGQPKLNDGNNKKRPEPSPNTMGVANEPTAVAVAAHKTVQLDSQVLPLQPGSDCLPKKVVPVDAQWPVPEARGLVMHAIPPLPLQSWSSAADAPPSRSWFGVSSELTADDDDDHEPEITLPDVSNMSSCTAPSGFSAPSGSSSKSNFDTAPWRQPDFLTQIPAPAAPTKRCDGSASRGSQLQDSN
jgi:hypothetical protein